LQPDGVNLWYFKL